MPLDTTILTHLITQSKTPMILSDSENNHIISQSFLALTELQPSTLQDKPLPLYSQNDQARLIMDEIKQGLKDNSSWTGYTHLLTKSGEPLQVALSVTYFSDATDQAEPTSNLPQRWLFQFEPDQVDPDKDLPVSPQQHDPITGLPNAHLFRDRIDQAILTAPRLGKSLALFIVKIDQFNIINSAYGPKESNRLLKWASEELKACVRHDDSVARYEEDQFALILQIASTDDSVLVAKKILRFICKDFAVSQHKIAITPRVGISLWPIDGKESSELLALANTALNQTQKKANGNYTFYSQEFNIRAKRRVELENRLRNALENHHFYLYYQPKVRAADRKIVGMEGLIRWIDPERGLVSPGEFIPLAEETGLIHDIGLWVLEEGCRQNKLWLEKKLSSCRLSLNVSSRQLCDDRFVDQVKHILQKTRLPARYLELEITESLLITNIDKTIEKLGDIRQLGCNIAIDDFGTGYSSLNYLTRIPLDTVKIDRSFISHIESEKKMAEVTRGIISLSKSLNLEVVAEGAETDAHINFLKNNECDSIQGFYYSKPLPADQFEDLLAKGYMSKEAQISTIPRAK